MTITNTGTATLQIGFLGLEGLDVGEFGIETNTCGATIQPDESCTLGIVFAPGQYKLLYAWIYLVDNASNSPQTVPLVGWGAH